MSLITAALVLGEMLKQPAWKLDKDAEAREDALRPVAEAITTVALETAQPSLAAARLIGLGWEETKFAIYVVTENCLSGPLDAQCDLDEAGVPQAISIFQLHRWAKGAWDMSKTREERQLAATRIANGRLEYYAHECLSQQDNDPIAAALAGYAKSDCQWPGGKRRATTVRRIQKQIDRWSHENK